MKGPLIKSRAGRYTWLQLLSLALGGVGLLIGNTWIVVVMLALATVFGVIAAMDRLKQAQRLRQQMPQRRRR